MKKCFSTYNHPKYADAVLLLLRIVWGLAMALHGWGKIQNPFAWAGPDSSIPGILQGLAALSEFGGGIAIILGLLTPLASLGIAITMLVAACLHAFVFGDPFVNMKGGGSYELATIYLVISLLFIAMGPGKYSLDKKIFGTKL